MGEADPTLDELASLLRARNDLDKRIAEVIGRPAHRGHIGEFIAARIFDIEAHASAVRKGSDGRFRSGPLAGRRVNVKFYSRQEGILDVHAGDDPPDYYLVMTGPRGAAASSRGRHDATVVENAYLLSHARLIEAGVKPGVAASVRQAYWRDAMLFPEEGVDAPIGLREDQRVALERFADTHGTRPTT